MDQIVLPEVFTITVSRWSKPSRIFTASIRFLYCFVERIVHIIPMLVLHAGLYYDRRWRDMGILVGFVGGFLSIALFLTRYVVHQKR